MRKLLQTRQVVASYTTRHKRKLMNAQLGNNAGTVETGTADFWWIRLHGDDNQVVRARSSRDVVPNAGIDVVVELVQREGLPYYQILGRALGILYPTEPYANRVVGHHEQHEQGDAGAGGFDPVSVFPRMVAPLRAHEETVPAMTVYVDAGDAAIGSTHLRFLGGSSPAFSNPTTFNRFDLVYLGTDNALHVLAGTEASGWVTPTRPTMTTAGVPIAWILLTASMTTILEGDIYDAGILRTGIELSSAVDLAATIHAATSKATPVDADEMPLADSAAAFGLKKLTWANLKATLKTYLDTLYAVLAHTHAGGANSPNLADEVVLHDKVGSPALFTLHDDWITRGSSGVIDGTQTYVTVGSTAVKISVIAGDGYVRLTNDQQGELVFCHWNASADIYTFSAPAAGQENVIFIGVEYSAGNVTAVTKTAFTDWNWFTNFPLARCSYDGTTMRIANLYAHAEDTANFARKVLRLTHPFTREEAPEGPGGLEVSDVATRQLAMTAGRIWHGFNNLILNAIAAGTTFYTYYRRAGGGFNLGTATQWENTLYDDASGTLKTITNNHYGTRWIWLDVSGNTVGSAYNGSLAMIYGSSNATSVALAQAEAAPSIPAHLQYHGKLIGRIIFQKSAAAATLVESGWANQFAASAVGNHNLLSGLQGGTAGEYYHLTSAEYTGTGTNNFVRESSPTIVTPTIASFANAQHNHADAAGGGQHNLLSGAHGDTTAAAVVRGDLITGQGASPTWKRLAISVPVVNRLKYFGTAFGDTEPGYKNPSINPGANAAILATDENGDVTIEGLTANVQIVSLGILKSFNTGMNGARIQLYHNGATATGAYTLSVVPANLTAARTITCPDADGTIMLVGAAPTAHNILSASHGDSTAAAAVRGDIITAQGVSPTWTRLAISVPAANILNVLGIANGETESSWKALFDATNPAALGAAAPGTSLLAAHRDHVHPTTGLALSATTLSVSGTGLSGGGDLSANRTITLTSSAAGAADAHILATDANGYTRAVRIGAGIDPSFPVDALGVGRFSSASKSYLGGDTTYAMFSYTCYYDGSWHGSGMALTFDATNGYIQSLAAGTPTTWGTISSSAGWAAGSSRDLKDRIVALSIDERGDLVNRFRRMPLYSYVRKDDPQRREIGVIAEEAVPEICGLGATVNYTRWLGVLSATMQDIYDRLDKLEKLGG